MALNRTLRQKRFEGGGKRRLHPEDLAAAKGDFNAEGMEIESRSQRAEGFVDGEVAVGAVADDRMLAQGALYPQLVGEAGFRLEQKSREAAGGVGGDQAGAADGAGAAANGTGPDMAVAAGFSNSSSQRPQCGWCELTAAT